jgi:hypothetical protein
VPEASQGSSAIRQWTRRILLVLVSAAVGAGIIYVALHKELRLESDDRVEQFIGSKRERDIVGARTERDIACAQFGQEHRRKVDAGYSVYLIDYFYSQKLDTCIEALENQTQNWYAVVDISGGFIKPSLEGIGDFGQGLFDCDTDGVDHTLIEKVREHRGYVYEVPYQEYLDDFNGNPPRTVKSAAKMFTRKDCEQFFAKELQEVR